SYPWTGRPQHLDVPMFVLFDQHIDADKVLAHVHVTVDGKPVDVRMLAPSEMQSEDRTGTVRNDKSLLAQIDAAKKNEQDGRWLAFRAKQDFPKDAAIHVEIGAGTPSAEGPNVTPQPQSFDFRTFPPLKVDEARCG